MIWKQYWYTLQFYYWKLLLITTGSSLSHKKTNKYLNIYLIYLSNYRCIGSGEEKGREDSELHQPIPVWWTHGYTANRNLVYEFNRICCKNLNGDWPSYLILSCFLTLILRLGYDLSLFDCILHWLNMIGTCHFLWPWALLIFIFFLFHVLFSKKIIRNLTINLPSHWKTRFNPQLGDHKSKSYINSRYGWRSYNIRDPLMHRTTNYKVMKEFTSYRKYSNDSLHTIRSHIVAFGILCMYIHND